jgi:hypothetical protein
MSDILRFLEAVSQGAGSVYYMKPRDSRDPRAHEPARPLHSGQSINYGRSARERTRRSLEIIGST